MERLRAGVRAVFETPGRGFYLIAELEGTRAGQMMFTMNGRTGATASSGGFKAYTRCLRCADAAFSARSILMLSPWHTRMERCVDCDYTSRLTIRLLRRPIAAAECARRYYRMFEVDKPLGGIEWNRTEPGSHQWGKSERMTP
jgi:hypothetical protein